MSFSACAMQRCGGASTARASGCSSARLVASRRPMLTVLPEGGRTALQRVSVLGDGAEEPKQETKKLLREKEPDEYWSSASEKEGNPMKDPVAIIGVLGILFPFIFVAIAIGVGAIDISVYK